MQKQYLIAKTCICARLVERSRWHPSCAGRHDWASTYLLPEGLPHRSRTTYLTRNTDRAFFFQTPIRALHDPQLIAPASHKRAPSFYQGSFISTDWNGRPVPSSGGSFESRGLWRVAIYSSSARHVYCLAPLCWPSEQLRLLSILYALYLRASLFRASNSGNHCQRAIIIERLMI